MANLQNGQNEQKEELLQSLSGSIRTDLAIESREMLHDSTGEDEIEGVKVTIEQNEECCIKITTVEITNDEGAHQMNKPIGSYITIESDAIKDNMIEIHEEISGILSSKLSELHDVDRNGVVLIVGLGNWNVTPDALGPKVVSKVLVTRHISECLPNELIGKVRRVSALSPGVMGITGIETGEIVRGIVDRVKPDLVIAIDALAARRANRINATIQMSNTGINPGAGVGNKRMSLNEETLGVPVIAIGVPTVVDAATLVNDTMDLMLNTMLHEAEKGSEFYQMLIDLESEEKYGIIKEILNPYAGNMFVTPKEVDAVIERLSLIIANALNLSLHPGIEKDDVNRYIS